MEVGQMKARSERDSMGEVSIPEGCLYGAQTARAVVNFPISGRGIGREMIRAIGIIKYAAAAVNSELSLLRPDVGEAIRQAALEVAGGSLDDHFPVDIFQTGSGTSSNMNANEVIANRANLLMGARVGARSPVHPNDHVNLGQSSNDVFPSALHVAASALAKERLLPALARLEAELDRLATELDGIVKTGRTHLQDATPIRLGQEFSGYSAQVRTATVHAREALARVQELALGGTAVGTGVNTHPSFGARMASSLSSLTGCTFREAGNHFQAQASMDGAVQVSGALKALSVGLYKIANDIRWMGSGPRLGLGELRIPPVQPGSSIMPGKVNPVIAESLMMVCVQVVGYDAAISLAGASGNFELNTMMPLIAHNLLEQMRLLANSIDAFTTKLLAGLKADAEAIGRDFEKSLALAAALVPYIGYDAAASLADESAQTGKTIREIAAGKSVLPADTLATALDPERLTGREPRL